MNEIQLTDTQRTLLVTELNRTLPFLDDHIAAVDLIKISTDEGPYSYSYERQRVFAEINQKQIRRAIIDALDGEPVAISSKGAVTLKVSEMLEKGAPDDAFADLFIKSNEAMIAMYKELLYGPEAEIKAFAHAASFFQKFLFSIQHQREAMIEIRDRLQMEDAHKSLESLVVGKNDPTGLDVIKVDNLADQVAGVENPDGNDANAASEPKPIISEPANQGSDPDLEVTQTQQTQNSPDQHLEINEIATAPTWENGKSQNLNDAGKEPIFEVSLGQGSQSNTPAAGTKKSMPHKKRDKDGDARAREENADATQGYQDEKGRRILLVKRNG